MSKCIFCKIVSGTRSCQKIWEDQDHVAFLSFFPNMQGFSIIIPKVHYPAHIFTLPDEVVVHLVLAAKKLGNLISGDSADAKRMGISFEGLEVDHLYAIVYPLHSASGHKKSKSLVSPAHKHPGDGDMFSITDTRF